jgi:FkbM family methyltransferase
MVEPRQFEVEGVKFYAPNPEDYIYADMIRSGQLWDRKRTQYMLRFIMPTSIVIDAGAHVGCHTIQFAKKAKRVIAIEPVEQNYKLWQINIQLNELTNCCLIKKALSNKTDKLVIDPERERLLQNSGATYLIPSKNGDIETTTLDTLLADEKDHLSFIKYDVEEMEQEALEGSIKTLEKYKPAIYVELIPDGHKNKRKNNNEKITSFLADIGYIKTKEIGVWINKYNQIHTWAA